MNKTCDRITRTPNEQDTVLSRCRHKTHAQSKAGCVHLPSKPPSRVPKGKFPFLQFHFEYAPTSINRAPTKPGPNQYLKTAKEAQQGSATAAKELDTQGIEPWTDHKFANYMQSDNYTPKPSARI
jgi:hypothetical protein